MAYGREIDMPLDVLQLDEYTYLVPHGIPLEAEVLVKAGVVKISLVNRNITVTPLESDAAIAALDSHPLFPTDEFLALPGATPLVTRFSHKLLEVLGITMETIYDFYSKSNQQLLEVDPSQLSISKGRLCFGEAPTEQMAIIWTGSTFVVAPISLKLVPPEEVVEEAIGSITGNQFRCKYGMLDIMRR